MRIEKASKKKTKARIAIFGPSGSGKTYSSLAIAKGMIESGLLPEGSRIVVIDTEHRSAEKYADRFDFDVLPLEDPKIDRYIEAIGMCVEYPILIGDSLSHPWRELLSEVDKLANAKYRGNTHSAWSEGTPKQRRLVEALLKFPGHIIVTMRSKTEWDIQKDDRSGKSKPVRIGLAPEQGKGIEYEFDLLLELSPDHIVNVLKDRTGKFQDRIIEKPGESFGLELIEWLNEGEDAAPPVDEFKEMVAAKKLGERAGGLLLLFLNNIRDEYLKKTKKSISHQAIKDKAVKDPEKFWLAFSDYLNKYNKEGKNDEAKDDTATPAGNPPAREGEGVVGQGEADPGTSDADCF